jgi:hypothetical protein
MAQMFRSLRTIFVTVAATAAGTVNVATGRDAAIAGSHGGNVADALQRFGVQGSRFSVPNEPRTVNSERTLNREH